MSDLSLIGGAKRGRPAKKTVTKKRSASKKTVKRGRPAKKTVKVVRRKTVSKVKKGGNVLGAASSYLLPKGLSAGLSTWGLVGLNQLLKKQRKTQKGGADLSEVPVPPVEEKEDFFSLTGGVKKTAAKKKSASKKSASKKSASKKSASKKSASKKSASKKSASKKSASKKSASKKSASKKGGFGAGVVQSTLFPQGLSSGAAAWGLVGLSKLMRDKDSVVGKTARKAVKTTGNVVRKGTSVVRKVAKTGTKAVRSATKRVTKRF